MHGITSESVRPILPSLLRTRYELFELLSAELDNGRRSVGVVTEAGPGGPDADVSDAGPGEAGGSVGESCEVSLLEAFEFGAGGEVGEAFELEGLEGAGSAAADDEGDAGVRVEVVGFAGGFEGIEDEFELGGDGEGDDGGLRGAGGGDGRLDGEGVLAEEFEERWGAHDFRKYHGYDMKARPGNISSLGFVEGRMKPGLFFLLVASAIAGDVSGTWRGTITIPGQGGDGEESPAYMMLRQKDGQVTGSAGQDEGEVYPIRNGKVEGDQVRFEVAPGNAVMTFVLKQDGEEMKGTVRREEDGRAANAEITVKREAREGGGR